MSFDIIGYIYTMGVGLWQFFADLPQTLEQLSVTLPVTQITTTESFTILGILSGSGLFLYMAYTLIVHWVLPG